MGACPHRVPQCSQRERWIPHPPPTHYVLQMEAVHLSAQPGFASTSTEEQGIDCETTLLRSATDGPFKPCSKHLNLPGCSETLEGATWFK